MISFVYIHIGYWHSIAINRQFSVFDNVEYRVRSVFHGGTLYRMLSHETARRIGLEHVTERHSVCIKYLLIVY